MYVLKSKTKLDISFCLPWTGLPWRTKWYASIDLGKARGLVQLAMQQLSWLYC